MSDQDWWGKQRLTSRPGSKTVMPGTKPWYSDWEEAAQYSKQGKAVSEPIAYQYKGKTVKAEVVIGRGRDPYLTMKDNNGFVLEKKLRSDELRSIRRWKPW